MNPKQVELTIRHQIDNRFKDGITTEQRLNKQRIAQMCFGELKLSIQASEYHYCSPCEDCNYYDEVEIGFPNFNFSDGFIQEYAEDKDKPQYTVYGYVPISELAKEISVLLEKQND